MAVLSAVSIAEIKARGSIKDADVLKVRRNYYDDGIITAEEADAIFAFNDACPVQDPAWADCFIETITDYSSSRPSRDGYLTAENCAVADRAHRQGRPGRDQDGAGAARQRARQGALGAAEPRALRARAGQDRRDRRHRPAALGQEARARPRRARPTSICCAASSTASAATAISRSRAPRRRCCSTSTRPPPRPTITRPGPTSSSRRSPAA